MDTVSMVKFRRDAEGVLRRLRRGERLILTYRGRPAARLDPVTAPALTADDPIYRLADLAVDGGSALTNDEIDAVVYEV